MFDVLAVRPALAAVAALALVPAAHAAEADASNGAIVTSQAVSFHDLDLGTTKGRNTLRWRMRMAAQSVCGYDGAHKSLSEMASEQDCYDRAMRDADTRVAAIISGRTVAAR